MEIKALRPLCFGGHLFRHRQHCGTLIRDDADDLVRLHGKQRLLAYFCRQKGIAEGLKPKLAAKIGKDVL